MWAKILKITGFKSGIGFYPTDKLISETVAVSWIPVEDARLPRQRILLFSAQQAIQHWLVCTAWFQVPQKRCDVAKIDHM